MPEIRFLPSDQVCKVDPGATILEAAKARGVSLASCCGGRALCTTCRVMIESGLEALSDIGEYEHDMLELLDIGPAYRLGCQARVDGDVVVRVPS